MSAFVEVIFGRYPVLLLVTWLALLLLFCIVQIAIFVKNQLPFDGVWWFIIIVSLCTSNTLEY